MSGRTLSVRNVGANIVINSDPCKDYGYKGRAEPPTEIVRNLHLCHSERLYFCAPEYK